MSNDSVNRLWRINIRVVNQISDKSHRQIISDNLVLLLSLSSHRMYRLFSTQQKINLRSNSKCDKTHCLATIKHFCKIQINKIISHLCKVRVKTISSYLRNDYISHFFTFISRSISQILHMNFLRIRYLNLLSNIIKNHLGTNNLSNKNLLSSNQILEILMRARLITFAN